MTTDQDEEFMRAALAEAKRALGRTSPNPAVGAVLVIDNHIVSRGHHREAGRAHAEIECLRNFGARIPLEELVIGATDLNPRHSGRGIAELRSAGVRVRDGILAEECTRLNEAFNKWIVTRQPFVIAKCGMSLDGRLTRPPGESRWITGRDARRDAHQLRARVDAVLVGAETVRADNPRLTIRGVRRVRQPWRVVLTRSGQLPRHAHVLSDKFAVRTLIYKQKSLASVLKHLGKRGITSVLIEGGGDVLGEALDKRLIDKVQIYLGPMLTGGPVLAFRGEGAEQTADALRLREIEYKQIGQTISISGYPDVPGRRITGKLSADSPVK
ncbi:MAG: bifunctional diaminohydroxyphosphoribosylaminopyrimidine deaminase/5-amino-6-(5-phosphoribosylamino)uracil reductase RibD [Verrucomicrobia bacterium]|nr:MAG: bifunctional diaminohydroxyphosphoribosylaminopyrimidine deaminase/5-amino-6-(5-phosphoribosylamino)uracil reductase RibD [Verrucomicrobiota bacterium]